MLFCILLIMLTVILFSYSYDYYQKTKTYFNHVTLLSFGFFLYLIMPMIVAELGVVEHNLLFSTFNYLFSQITLYNKLLYFIFISLVYMFFMLGTNRYRLKHKVPNKKRNINEKSVTKEIKKINMKIFNILMLLIAAVALIYIAKNSSSFFTGYDYGINRGTLAAIVLVVFSLAMFYDLITWYKTKDIKKTFLNVVTIMFVILSILLLSVGTRMYFMSCIITLMILMECFFKFKGKYILWFLAVVVGFVAFIALIRSGYLITISSGFFTLLMEFLYTFISSLKFLELGIFKLISVPIFLISNLINLIPTFICPDKLSYLLNPADFGFVIYSPMGALSIYVDLMINFGLIGSMVAIYYFSYGLEFLSNQKDSLLYIVIYPLICGFLGFSLFRDSFTTSIIKNILEFSIIIPVFYYYIIQVGGKNEKSFSNKRHKKR